MLELLAMYRKMICEPEAMELAVRGTYVGSEMRLLMARGAVRRFMHSTSMVEGYEEALGAVGFGFELAIGTEELVT